ncbi:MAG: response regulator transcription factor [Bacteroidales bacterium]|nr:response regulator transcription factor [Bacteroidales bacterium]
MKKLKAIIVDDEKPARDIVLNYLEKNDNIEVIATCENGFEALKELQENEVDLMFLDIQMPKISGFELLDVLGENKPMVVFCTAYDEYAVKAFEKSAIDYLLKPFSKERFDEALNKALQNTSGKKDGVEKLVSLKNEDNQEIERIIIRQGSKIHVVPITEIRYIEAQDDYVKIYSEKGDFLKDRTMKYYETVLDAKGFIRIHRSHIVNINYMDKVELYEKDTHLLVLKSGEKLKVSREGYKRLRERL